MTLLFYFIKSTIMNKVIILAGLLCCMHTLYAQNTPAKKDTIRKEISLEEVVISASNFAEKKRNIAQKIDVINAATIAATNAQNTGDLLINTGKVFVQKSQQGGSSPVLRGFEASRVLLVVDGVRMNNAMHLRRNSLRIALIAAALATTACAGLLLQPAETEPHATVEIFHEVSGKGCGPSPKYVSGARFCFGSVQSQ